MAQTVATKGTRAPKAVQQETAKALTKAQETALAKLVESANASITGAISAERELANVVTQLADFKVFAARSLARLSAHPAVVATRGTKAGQPALTKMATLVGRPATTLETYWKSAQALIGKGWQNRTGAPNDAERALVMASFKSESARVASYAPKTAGKPGAKGKGGKPVVKSTAATFDSIGGQLDGALETVTKYVATMGFTKDEANELASKLDAILDAIESAVTK